jgi:hypothetical protein
MDKAPAEAADEQLQAVTLVNFLQNHEEVINETEV